MNFLEYLFRHEGDVSPAMGILIMFMGCFLIFSVIKLIFLPLYAARPFIGHDLEDNFVNYNIETKKLSDFLTYFPFTIPPTGLFIGVLMFHLRGYKKILK